MKLTRHYNDEIKCAIFERGINNCEQLIELLEEFDQIGSTNNGYTKKKTGEIKTILQARTPPVIPILGSRRITAMPLDRITQVMETTGHLKRQTALPTKQMETLARSLS